MTEESEEWSKGDDRLFGWNLSPKCTKRSTRLDESIYMKQDATNESSIKDTTYIRSLIQSAHKIQPFIPGRLSGIKNSSLPQISHPSIKKQIDHLRDIQRGINRTEQDYTNIVFLEEFKYLDALRPLLTKRFCVIIGEFLPEEKNNNNEILVKKCVKDNLPVSDSERNSSIFQVWKGFWQGVLEHCLPTSLMIYPWDRDILNYLIDIRCTNFTEPPAFSLDFLFASNPFFSNISLSRHFEYRKIPANDLIGISETYTPASCSGCVIHWLPEKDVTIRTKQMKPDKEFPETKKIQIFKRSFFHFFSPVVKQSQPANQANKPKQLAFELDFYIASIIRKRLIPNAVQFYLATTKDPLCVQAKNSHLHPARKTTAADLNRLLSMEELEHLEEIWMKKDGHHQSSIPCDGQTEQHVRRGLERLGYHIRQGKAFRRGDVTTSGESSCSLSNDSDSNKIKQKKKRNIRGLMEKRRHDGIKLAELEKIADESVSEDDRASMFDLQSDSGDSFDSDIVLLAGSMLTGNEEYCRKKTTTKVAQGKLK